MNRIIRIFIIAHVLFLATAIKVLAQKENIPIGQWRTHSSFAKVSLVAYDGNKIYSAPTSKHVNLPGTIISVDSDGEISTMSKESGLSDFGVAQLGYSINSGVLVIAYENGNIDFIKASGEIVNLSEIKRKDIVGLKIANHLNFHEDVCIVSYDFGIVILDLKKLEVKETITSVVAQSGINKISSTAIVDNKIFALSEKGLYSAAYNATVNLMDVRSWSNIPVPFDLKNESVQIIAFKSNLYAAASRDGVYEFKDNNWTKISSLSTQGYFYNLSVSNSKMLLCTAYAIFSTSNGKDFEVEINERGDLISAVFDKNNALWIATPRGLARKVGIDKISLINISTPNTNSSFRSYFNKYKNELIVLGGGYNDFYGQVNNSDGFSVYKDGIWESFKLINTPPVKKTFIDIVDVKYSPTESKYYFASYGWGLAALNINDSSYIFYDTTNSSLDNSFDSGAPGMRVASLAFERDKLWIGAEIAPEGRSRLPLHTLENGKMSVVPNIPSISPMHILVDSNNYKWIVNAGYSTFPVVVYNSTTQRTINLDRDFFSGTSGSTQISKVNCIELDYKGQMWVGTDKGIAIITESANIFNMSGNSKAYRPIFEGFPLLYTEQILSIQVDGANRKWVGTNNGVWLLSEDGSEVISRFTTENSPLPSNKVKDIEIVQTTGEVFFSTDICLVSYRGTATAADAKTKGIKIFPSPVPPAYDGQISIQGLPSNECLVKITDELGTMIYEMKSTGGSAVWNGRNYSGMKAKSGMYLVFTSDKEGDNNFIGKFAIIE